MRRKYLILLIFFVAAFVIIRTYQSLDSGEVRRAILYFAGGVITIVSATLKIKSISRAKKALEKT